MRKIVVDPFTGQPRVEEVEEPRVNAGIPGDTGPAGPTGPQGEPGTIPDNALTRTTGNPLRDGFGGNINLGTNGTMIFRYQRVGRIVDLWIQIWADGDWSADNGGFFLIPFADLPYTPLAVESPPSGITTVNAAIATAFGYMSYAPNNPAIAAAPAVTGAGGGSIAFIIIVNDGSGGLGNLMSGTNPVALTGVEWQYTGYVRYEAASAA